jgi:hypothetical protein
VKWEGPNLVLFELGDHRFYVDTHYNKQWAESCRLHITVEDAQAWFEHISAALKKDEKLKDIEVHPPRHEDYGALVTYVCDPSGVLLDFAQRLS